MKSTPHLLALAIGLAAVDAGLGQPAITRQPTDLSLSIGATATFRVTAATTNPPLSYQWRHQNISLVSATNASLTLTNIQMTDAGSYTVTVTDFAGETTSSTPGILDVDPAWTKITSDPIVTDHGYDASTGFWADLDDDGFLDLFLVTDVSGHNPTYHNNGDGTFTRVCEPSLQSVRAVDLVYTWGDYAHWGDAAWADYDNDGDLDVFLTTARPANPNDTGPVALFETMARVTLPK